MSTTVQCMSVYACMRMNVNACVAGMECVHGVCVLDLLLLGAPHNTVGPPMGARRQAGHTSCMVGVGEFLIPLRMCAS